MLHLLVSFVAALAVSIAVYLETSSIVLAFLAYSGAGVAVLMTILISSMFSLRADDAMEPREN